jgi:hypothetical protein
MSSMITDAMFVTAEDSQNYRRGVWVMLTTWSLKLDRGTVPAVFVVTTSTGYRAELEACLFDGHPDGFVNCVKPRDAYSQHGGMSVDRWCEHIQTHCHNYHLPLASAFAARVAKTYGSAVRKDAPRGLLAHPLKVDNVGIKAWADDWYAKALEGR